MASVAMMIGGAVVNALAFTGSNFLFSSNHEEQKRHDKAVEELQEAQAKWSHKRTQRIDWINEELRRRGIAMNNFRDVDAAMYQYSLLTKQNLPRLEKQPVISDFYVPSESQKDREIAFIILGMSILGVVVYKLEF